MSYFCWLPWLLFLFLGTQGSTPWMSKETTSLMLPQKLLLSKKPVAKPLSWAKGMFSQMISWKNWREIPNNWPPREKNNIGNPVIVGLIKRELWFGPNINTALPEILEFPLLTTVHALNHLSTARMIAFVNHYWWGNSNKATKSAYLAFLTCTKYNPWKPVCTSGFHIAFLYYGYEYVLVMIYMFSHWTDAFPCTQAKLLLQLELC